MPEQEEEKCINCVFCCKEPGDKSFFSWCESRGEWIIDFWKCDRYVRGASGNGSRN